MPKAKPVKLGNKQLNEVPRKRKSLTEAQKKERNLFEKKFLLLP